MFVFKYLLQTRPRILLRVRVANDQRALVGSRVILAVWQETSGSDIRGGRSEGPHAALLEAVRVTVSVVLETVCCYTGRALVVIVLLMEGVV